MNSVIFNSAPSMFNNAETSLASASLSVESVNNSLWHYKLGHLSDSPLKLLSHVIPQVLHESNKTVHWLNSIVYLFLIAHLFLNNLLT
jgi:hypothetical protein